MAVARHGADARRVRLALVGALALLAGCRGRRHPAADGEHGADDATVRRPDAGSTLAAPPGDAATGSAAATAWPALEGYDVATPTRVVALPVQASVPRLETVGPVIVGVLAVVGSSQLGFLAIDWRSGDLAWRKPTGAHVAPPIAIAGGAIALVGECLSPPRVPADHTLLGCLRVVTPAGADQAYVAVHGPSATVAPFLAARGEQSMAPVGDRAIRWRRDDQAVRIDLMTGLATPTLATTPPFVVTRGARRWSISSDDDHDGHIVATGTGGARSWRTDHQYHSLLGIAVTADGAPLVRVMNAGAFLGQPELRLIDMDATGSMRAQVARPVPGVSVLGWALSSIGDAAIAARLDTSLTHDFIVGYAANAFLAWVYPLPVQRRADPVGIAIAPSTADLPGAVVVFHDGDTLTVLPELSAPPTAPGAARAPSENPTP